MEKILILTEGQTELILLKNIFLNLFLQDKFSMHCIELKSDRFGKFYFHDALDPMIYFELINIGNDEKVLTFIRDNNNNYFSKGFNRIIGLRDIYCERYTKKSNCYDRDLIIELEEISNKRISELKNYTNIKIYFAVMEIEAWFLAMFKLFEKFNTVLNPEYIFEVKNFDIINTKPEEIFRPSEKVNDIYKIINKRYKKSKSCAEGLTSRISLEDIEIGVKDNRCIHLENFFNEIVSYRLPLIRN